MRAREIIYYMHSDMYTKKLNKAIERLWAIGKGFKAGILQSRLQRWLAAAVSEEVKSQTAGNFKAVMRKHKKECGRERFTLKDLNRIRKLRYAATHEIYNDLQTKEVMYGNKNSK